jgi:glycosyltransferase
MRVLFTAIGGRPHVYPLVPLAWACWMAGHEVRFASSPRMARDIVHTGLPTVGVGGSPVNTQAQRDDLVAAVFGQDSWPPGYAADLAVLDAGQLGLLRRLGRYLATVSEAIVDELVGYALRWRPDLVVYEASTYAGPVVAAVLGIPGVRHLFGSDSFPRLEFDVPTGEPLAEYARLFERFGVPVSTSATAIVEPTPPRMRLAEEAPLIGMRYLPFNGPGAEPAWLPAWLRDSVGRPRVCVTWGYTGPLSLGSNAAGPYRVAVEALAALDASIVVLTTAEQLAQLGTLPDRVAGVAGVPLQLVVPHCDLLVHQGGDGTTLTGACYAVPQLAITRKPDAETPAARMAAVGLGLHLPYQHLAGDPAAGETITTAAERVLTEPSFRSAATSLRAEIEGQPAPAEIVPLLERLAGTST